MAPRQEDFQVVREAVGWLIAELKVAKYVVKAWGIEGGFHICMEKSPFAELKEIVTKLSAIEVDKKQTHYRIQEVLNC